MKTKIGKLNSSKMEGMEDKWKAVGVVLPSYVDVAGLGQLRIAGGWLPLIRCFNVVYR
jgi:hypothetical protein